MQSSGGRTRRQTRQSAAAQSATSSEHGSSTNDHPSTVSRYTPGATLGYGPTATPATRVTRRSARNATPSNLDAARMNPEPARQAFSKAISFLGTSKQITQEEADRIVAGSHTVEPDKIFKYLEEAVGEERWKTVMMHVSIENARMNQRQRETQQAMMQQKALANAGARPATYPMQYGLAHGQMGGHPMAQQAVRPMAYNQNIAQQLTQRSGQQSYQQDAMGYPLGQRAISGSPSLQTVRARMPNVGIQASGEVAKTLMPPRGDSQIMQYPPGSYHTASVTQMSRPPGFSLEGSRSQVGNESRAVTEPVSSKRVAAAPIENTTAKAARYTKARRAVEDPSAPDVGDMDAVTEAAIHLADEQEALLTDVPSQGVTDADGQVIESNILNVGAVKMRLQQVLREQGMQLGEMDGADVMIQGMEEKFEGLLAKALKRAIHRAETAYVNSDTDTKHVTSDVRNKLREIKKKQEQHKANKLREEREKLEQLAETASKKELASNKELAAKVEKVKREKQFNAETEAANRALSYALGDFGFAKYRKMRKEKEAREAAASATGCPATTAPMSAPTPPPPRPATSAPPVTPPVSVAKPTPPPPPAYKPPPEEKRPVVLKVKDIMSVMTQDNHYAFSPILYRVHLW